MIGDLDVGLEVHVRSERSAVLAVRGRLDAVTAPAIKARVQDLLAEGRPELVLDLSGVGFLDSSALAALVSGWKATRERGGFLKLVGCNEQVARIFRLTTLDHVFEIYPSAEAAFS